MITCFRKLSGLTINNPIINFYKIEFIKPFIPQPIFTAKKIYFTECKVDFLLRTININMFPYVETMYLINTIGIIPSRFYTSIKSCRRIDNRFSDPSKINFILLSDSNFYRRF